MTQGEQDGATSRTCEHFTLMSSWPWRSPCYCCAHHTLTRSERNGNRKGKKRRENDGHSRQSRARLAPSTVERSTFEAGEPTARRRAAASTYVVCPHFCAQFDCLPVVQLSKVELDPQFCWARGRDKVCAAASVHGPLAWHRRGTEHVRPGVCAALSVRACLRARMRWSERVRSDEKGARVGDNRGKRRWERTDANRISLW